MAREKAVEPNAIEIWFSDEARIGQKNKITRRWAELTRDHDERSLSGWSAEGRRGTRPSAPHDQRTALTYIFGAICPKEGKAAGLILPYCNIEAMTLHLAEISATVTPGRHAALLLDQAGWHTSDKLVVPHNITLIPLPPKCPELKPPPATPLSFAERSLLQAPPVENVWEFMRDNWLSNRVFKSYTAIVDHCAEAWNKLVDRPWRIMSIGLRRWTHRF